MVLVSFSTLNRGLRKVWFSSGAILHTTDLAPMKTMASTAKSFSARSGLRPLQRAMADPEGSRVHSCPKHPQWGRKWEKLENRWHPLKRSQENHHLHNKAWQPIPPPSGSRKGTPGVSYTSLSTLLKLSCRLPGLSFGLPLNKVSLSLYNLCAWHQVSE